MCGFRCKKSFWLSLNRKKVRLLLEVLRLFENFILKRLFCNRVLELLKDNQKQPRSLTSCVGPSAKRIFSLARIKNVRLLVEVCRLFENFVLKGLFL